MPRAADLYPSRRLDDTHNPLNRLLDWTSPLSMTAAAAGDGIRSKIEDVVAFIYATTGIDLSGINSLLDIIEVATSINLFDLGQLEPVSTLQNLVAALQGIDWTSPGSVLEAINTLSGGAIDIAEALLGIDLPDPGDPLEFLETFGNNLRSVFPGVDFNAPSFNPQAALANLVNLGLMPLNILLGRSSPLNAANLFGSIFPHMVPMVSLSSIGDVADNLHPDPTFSDADAIDEVDGWSHDPAIGRTTAGSARVVADGQRHEMLSDPATAVAPGQKMVFTVYARRSNLVGGTLPVQMGVATYDETGAFIATVPIGALGPGNAGFASITGSYTVAAGVRFVRQSIALEATATSGVVNFDDADYHKTQRLALDMVNQLPENLEDLGGRVQDVLNHGWTAIFGDDEGIIDRTADEFEFALRNIPALNVLGVGAANMVDTVTDILDNVWRGLMRAPSASGKSIADVANAASNTSEVADTGLQVGEWNNAVLGIRDNNGFDSGMDPTAIANYELPGPTASGADPAYVTVGSATVPVVFWLSPDDAVRGSFAWYGRGAANITAFYIDVYRVNKDTAQLEFLHTSPDQVPKLSANWKALRYNMQTADRVAVAHGDILAFGFRLQGTGTHHVVGKWAGWLPPDTDMVPPHPAAVRPAAGVGTIDLSSLSYTGDIPWVAVGIVEGDVPPPYFAPRTTAYTTYGTYVYNVPSWAKYVDGVYASAGGGGAGGNPIAPVHGRGGAAGEWVAETLVRGVDFPDVPNATLTITVALNGVRGNVNTNGSKGGDTFRHAITGGKAEVRAVGGDGGSGQETSAAGGGNMGNFEYEGSIYTGGNGGISVAGQAGHQGSPPGGGGGGGAGGTWGVAWPGGHGGHGGAFFTARQS